jgi:hypothetical protein
MGRLVIPPAPAYGLWLPDEGTRHAGEAPSGLLTASVVIGERFCPLCASPWNIIVKIVLTKQYLPPGKFMMSFRRVPKVWRRRW